jgi:phosphoglycolate phosphatase
MGYRGKSSKPHILKSSNSRFRLVVFDLDGTLVDSLGDLAESANALLVACGGRALPQDSIGRMVGEGAGLLVARAFEAAGLSQPPDALERFLAIYDARLLTLTRPYPGIGQLLAEIEHATTLAVLTNKPIQATRAILDGLDLSRHFSVDRVIGGDGPLPRKPDPAGLRHLADRAGVPLGETLLVGDSLIDWRTSRAAPAAICLARYGFGFQSFPVAEIGADDLLIDAPLDLVSIL